MDTSYLNPVEIATAFNTCVTRDSWHARASARSVVFTSAKGIVTLTMDVDARTFKVTFKRARATFVDYTKAVARSLFVVLGALKAAGLPFEAPASLVGIVVESRPTEGSDVYVEWRPRPGEITGVWFDEAQFLHTPIKVSTGVYPRENNLPDI